DKYEVIIVIWIIIPIILFFVSDIFSHNTMTGADGLKNIILSITVRTLVGIIIAVPIAIIGTPLIKLTDFRKSKLFFFGTVFMTVVVPLIVFGNLTRSRLNEHHHIRNQYNIFADYSTLFQCVSDLANDNYEEFTINNSYINRHQHRSSSGRGGSSYRSSYHYEYTVTFYNGSQKIAESQISADDIDYISNLPVGFDTKITIYSKSGFIRSIEPSVDFGKEESYEHYFTLSIDGDNIVYERNVNSDVEIKNLTWSGFKKNRSYDIHNSLFGINAENDNSFDRGFVTCNEICLYGVVDGQYRRISNIIADN
ncbi:MAG: hypothetical protein K2J40_06200, partial [Ruminococcus sp.]|nr:hypothetical protein [Ruminococcus sp.]